MCILPFLRFVARLHKAIIWNAYRLGEKGSFLFIIKWKIGAELAEMCPFSAARCCAGKKVSNGTLIREIAQKQIQFIVVAHGWIFPSQQNFSMRKTHLVREEMASATQPFSSLFCWRFTKSWPGLKYYIRMCFCLFRHFRKVRKLLKKGYTHNGRLHFWAHLHKITFMALIHKWLLIKTYVKTYARRDEVKK